MKLELYNKKRIEKLSKLMNDKEQEIKNKEQAMKDKKQEIEDEFIPGSYQYDIQQVEKLKNEYKRIAIECDKIKDEYNKMKDEYEQTKAIPTKESLDNEIEDLNKQLKSVEEGIKYIDEEIKEQQNQFIGANYIPKEVLEPREELAEKTKLEEQREDIKNEISERQELINIINEINTTEKEINKIKREISNAKKEQEKLYKEQNDGYAGAYFIPEEDLEELRSREEELKNKEEELKSKENKLKKLEKEFSLKSAKFVNRNKSKMSTKLANGTIEKRINVSETKGIVVEDSQTDNSDIQPEISDGDKKEVEPQDDTTGKKEKDSKPRDNTTGKKEEDSKPRDNTTGKKEEDPKPKDDTHENKGDSKPENTTPANKSKIISVIKKDNGKVVFCMDDGTEKEYETEEFLKQENKDMIFKINNVEQICFSIAKDASKAKALMEKIDPITISVYWHNGEKDEIKKYIELLYNDKEFNAENNGGKNTHSNENDNTKPNSNGAGTGVENNDPQGTGTKENDNKGSKDSKITSIHINTNTGKVEFYIGDKKIKFKKDNTEVDYKPIRKMLTKEFTKELYETLEKEKRNKLY